MPAHQRTSQALCRALADPMRIRILNLLRRRHELFASDLVTVLGLHRNDLNWHIKLLERAQLVSCRRVGLNRQYRFTGELSEFHHRLVDFLTSVEALVDHEEGVSASPAPGSD